MQRWIFRTLNKLWRCLSAVSGPATEKCMYVVHGMLCQRLLSEKGKYLAAEQSSKSAGLRGQFAFLAQICSHESVRPCPSPPERPVPISNFCSNQQFMYTVFFVSESTVGNFGCDKNEKTGLAAVKPHVPMMSVCLPACLQPLCCFCFVVNYAIHTRNEREKTRYPPARSATQVD